MQTLYKTQEEGTWMIHMQCQAISQTGHMTYMYYYSVQNELILKYTLVQINNPLLKE